MRSFVLVHHQGFERYGREPKTLKNRRFDRTARTDLPKDLPILKPHFFIDKDYFNIFNIVHLPHISNNAVANALWSTAVETF